jgi:exosome complex exonuclease RRP6
MISADSVRRPLFLFQQTSLLQLVTRCVSHFVFISADVQLPGPFAQGKSLGRLPSSILHDSSLAKPQLLFSDTVDNISPAPWKPTLDTKEHAMVPLGFDVPLEYELTPEERAEPDKAEARKKREMRLATHPYYYETRHLPYPTSMFTITEPREPASFEETPFTFVDTPEALEKMVGKLQQAKEIAVDLEHHSLRTYYGITCLIQISDRNEDWIVDTLALRTELREKKLGGVMTDPSIVKVLHGSDSDIHWLQRDFDIYIVNLFDTFHATKVLGFAQHSLAYLLSHYCQFEADKRYQMADWRARPLPEEMMDYARSDTHFLLYIYDRLRNALLEESSRPPSPVDGADVEMVTQRRNPQEAMRSVLERSGDTALRMYEREMYDSEKGRGSGGWANAARKSLYQGAIDEEVGAVFKAVHAWRDQLARTEDEAPT